MTHLPLVDLLDDPELMATLAPWCRPLDNLELAVVLLCLPWNAGSGLRRAALERQLQALATELPVGPVYFQRVSRATAALEGSGTLRAEGGGRAVRLRVTPQGMVSLILNLRLLRADPTIDGSEFELKRGLVAIWATVSERLGKGDGGASEETGEEVYAEAERIELLGQPVLSDALVRDALDVQRLIARQRQRVLELKGAAQARCAGVTRLGEQLEASTLRQLLAGSGTAPADDVLAALRVVAFRTVPRLHLEAALARYDHYLRYLDALSRLYSAELKVVDLRALRRPTDRVG
jgi:hypothetical protein